MMMNCKVDGDEKSSKVTTAQEFSEISMRGPPGE
jgi:hypothetical protein